MSEPLPAAAPPRAERPICPRERFVDLVSRPDVEVDLAEAALWISAEERPGVEVGRWLARLDELGAEARRRIAAVHEGPGAELERLERLCELLFVELGFGGDREDYHDPAASFLDRVLARRRGIPITLAVVLLEVGRRAGVPLVGVGFPCHFLVRSARHPQVLLDPFEGTLLTAEDCRRLLARVCGGRIPFHPRLLAPVGPRAILHRMLNNLRAVHLARGDEERALAALDRMLLLAPDDAVHLRERGLLRLGRGEVAAALDDLARYVAVEPEAPDRAAVQDLLARGPAPATTVH